MLRYLTIREFSVESGDTELVRVEVIWSSHGRGLRSRGALP
jgi:hypothetical protein